MILALLAVWGAMVVAFILYPVFTEATAGAPAAFHETDVELSDLRDKKAMLYESIQDLDFEKAAGKLSDSDYESARSDYLTQVAGVIAKLDTLVPPQQEPVEPVEGDPEKPTQQALELECGSCSELNPVASNFCFQCGKPLTTSCASCGESLPDRARFCNACGEKVGA